MIKEDLLYIECPNCKETFESTEKFFPSKSFIGLNKFSCQKCKRQFKYPTKKNYGIDLFIGLTLWTLSTLMNPPIGDILQIGAQSVIGIAGFFLTLQGIWGIIENSSLKKGISDWENRLHNTTSVWNDALPTYRRKI